MNIRKIDWEKYQKTDPTSFDGSSIGVPKKSEHYLHNRLWLAFTAGYDAGVDAERERIKSNMVAALTAVMDGTK